MKFEKNFKILFWTPLLSFIGIIIGIIVADKIQKNIGMGISWGLAIGFFVGACTSFILSKIQSRKKK